MYASEKYRLTPDVVVVCVCVFWHFFPSVEMLSRVQTSLSSVLLFARPSSCGCNITRERVGGWVGHYQVKLGSRCVCVCVLDQILVPPQSMSDASDGLVR